jgi:hypothetical protein
MGCYKNRPIWSFQSIPGVFEREFTILADYNFCKRAKKKGTTLWSWKKITLQFYRLKLDL